MRRPVALANMDVRAASWEEARPGNHCGALRGLTTLAALHPAWALLLRTGFRIGTLPLLGPLLVRIYVRKLRRLSFIHFARWSVIDSLPAADPERLASPYLLFDTNFDGDFDQYIDAFSYVIGLRIRYFWHGAYGFPGPMPPDPFKAFIVRQEHEASLYWSAYPEASATMVASALALSERLERFTLESRGLDPETFAERYRRLLTDVQGAL